MSDGLTGTSGVPEAVKEGLSPSLHQLYSSHESIDMVVADEKVKPEELSQVKPWLLEHCYI